MDDFVQQRKIFLVEFEEWDESPKGKAVPKLSVQGIVTAVHASLGHVGTLPKWKWPAAYSTCYPTSDWPLHKAYYIDGPVGRGQQGQRRVQSNGLQTCKSHGCLHRIFVAWAGPDHTTPISCKKQEEGVGRSSSAPFFSGASAGGRLRSCIGWA